ASVTRRASPPVIGRTNTCARASRPGVAGAVARNASRSPEGDHRGCPTPRRWEVRVSVLPVATSTRTRSASYLFSSRSARDTVTTMLRPSGAICGSAMRTMRPYASRSIRVWARAGVAHARNAPTMTRIRFMSHAPRASASRVNVECVLRLAGLSPRHVTTLTLEHLTRRHGVSVTRPSSDAAAFAAHVAFGFGEPRPAAHVALGFGEPGPGAWEEGHTIAPFPIVAEPRATIGRI